MVAAVVRLAVPGPQSLGRLTSRRPALRRLTARKKANHSFRRNKSTEGVSGQIPDLKRTLTVSEGDTPSIPPNVVAFYDDARNNPLVWINPKISAKDVASQWNEKGEGSSRDKGARNRSPADVVRSKLSGRLIAVKDNFCIEGVPTTCSSRMLRGFRAPYTATCVKSLFGSDDPAMSGHSFDGPRLLGKTHMDEFGMGSTNWNLPEDLRDKVSVWNPLDMDISEGDSRGSWEPRTAGGSSGGSAAVVGSGLVWAALGTDTGGSVRLPASYCGVVGHKPSYGLISRHGVVSYADSLDCVGILARDVETTENVFDLISHPDAADATCVSHSVRDEADEELESSTKRLLGLRDGSLKGLRVGVPVEVSRISEYTTTFLRPYLTRLRDLGATLVPVSIPHMTLALPAYYVLACAEASSNLARYGGGFFDGDGRGPSDLMDADVLRAHGRRAVARSFGFGAEVKKRLLAGSNALTADAFNNSYLKALEVRRRLREDYSKVFRARHVVDSHQETRGRANHIMDKGVDVLIHPTTLSPAPKLRGKESAEADENASSSVSTLDDYRADLLTTPASMAGLPCLSVPIVVRNPDSRVKEALGMSLTAQWGLDKLLFDIARATGH